MQKEEVIERIVNVRIQIAALRMEEKGLIAQLDLTPREKTMNTVRNEIKVPHTPKDKRRKPRSYYHRQKMSAKMKAIWATRTPEERRAWAMKVVEKRRTKKG